MFDGAEFQDRLKRLFGFIVAAGTAVGVVILVFLAVEMFADFRRDTITLSGACFTVVAALAGLCFSYARTLDGTPAEKKQIVVGGEQLFFSALLFLVATLIKYFLLRDAKGQWDWQRVDAVVGVVGVVAGLFFALAGGAAGTGLFTVIQILNNRHPQTSDNS